MTDHLLTPFSPHSHLHMHALKVRPSHLQHDPHLPVVLDVLNEKSTCISSIFSEANFQIP